MKLLSTLSLLTVASLLLHGCATDSRSDSAGSSTGESPIIGIDISKYQGSVDFAAVRAATISYVFIRATEGITYQDADFATNIAAARAAGLVVGAYHFYETNDEPNAQLANFTGLVSLQRGDLPPVVDIEKLHDQDDANLTENIQTFLTGLQAHYGVKPILYTGRNFANEYMGGFGDYPLWLAEYDVDAPTLPQGWSDWTFWQWSQATTIAGIDGQVDADRYNGNQASFRSLLLQ